MYKDSCGVTLMELLIAIALIGLVVLGLSSIVLFSRVQLRTSDIRVSLQNNASFALDHMTKNIEMAMGNVNQYPLTLATIGGDPGIRVWIDYNQNGRWDASDREIAYRFTFATGGPPTRDQIWYYANCLGPNCNLLGSIGPEVIAQRISQVTWTFASNPRDNFVSVDITSCQDPDGIPNACGTLDNPAVTMSTRIKMPSVSAN